MRPVIIVGGGISGLSTAYYLQQAGIKPCIVERQPHLGGVITTEVVDGCVVEGGPDSFLSAKPWAMDLIREVGLEDQVIGSNDHLRVTYVRRNKKLVPLPDGLMMMVPTKVMPLITTRLLSWTTKIRMGLELVRRPPARPGPDRSVADFVREHYGPEAVDYLAEPLLAGVYGGSPEQLSVASVLPRFVELEKKYGSLTRGVLVAMKRARATGANTTLFRTLKEGLGQLTGRLEEQLTDLEVLRGDVSSVERTPEGYRLRVDGDWVNAAEVVLACQAYQAGALLRELDPQLSAVLQEIPYSSSMTVALGYDRAGFAHPLNGFGFLVPQRERGRMIACTWVGTKFPNRVPDSRVMLRVFLGGAEDAAVLDESDESVVRMVRDELNEVMGVTETPTFTRVSRWPRSMAQYSVGHAARVKQITDRSAALPGLHLTGNAYHGIGIPDCIRMGKETAATIAEASVST